MSRHEQSKMRKGLATGQGGRMKIWGAAAILGAQEVKQRQAEKQSRLETVRERQSTEKAGKHLLSVMWNTHA